MTLDTLCCICLGLSLCCLVLAWLYDSAGDDEWHEL